MKTKNETEELFIRVVGILVDYKFNSTQIKTTEMVADEIIEQAQTQTKLECLKSELEFLEYLWSNYELKKLTGIILSKKLKIQQEIKQIEDKR